MGWFSWFSSKPDISSGVAPDRSQRQVCWDARDCYYACLDKNSVLKPGEERNVCTKEKKSYEGNCAKSWIAYFDKRRVLAEEQKDQLALAQAQADAARAKR
ncbi:cytochrome oxidase c subunit VIb-domain-containing protein [Hysterangium stoloniferum]|nr:cytochrome oxidase c subunit VIb-domain-containing protein [Hysterangium stoloniferum]